MQESGDTDNPVYPHLTVEPVLRKLVINCPRPFFLPLSAVPFSPANSMLKLIDLEDPSTRQANGL